MADLWVWGDAALLGIVSWWWILGKDTPRGQVIQIAIGEFLQRAWKRTARHG